MMGKNEEAQQVGAKHVGEMLTNIALGLGGEAAATKAVEAIGKVTKTVKGALPVIDNTSLPKYTGGNGSAVVEGEFAGQSSAQGVIEKVAKTEAATAQKVANSGETTGTKLTESDTSQPSLTPLELVQQASNQSKHIASIGLEHIIDGEVKPVVKSGVVVGKRAVGGHYLRSSNVRVTEIIGESDANGVMKAKIQVHDPDTGGWVDKTAPSTFYPENWSKRQVKIEIQEAFYNSKPIGGDMWEGKSPSGVTIRGYYKVPDGSASTAWPVYSKE
ncbi:EndoU domain-containing protein [Vibrio gazogenes]|uniref:Bacterial EndoU nuclease domain-containing protein n=1 Tax=Vibrio gazogenes TaxID=687 RepID=A0A1Z2SL71_VIBGA|nr:EndoU domain-containing protein [Vibrio gazogenes]ASA57899.1 hypothetical protein BSQ33_19500 [Vibrio gazogenes]